MKVAPIQQSHVHELIKIWLTLFEKGHSRNIAVNWGLEATDSVVLTAWILLLNLLDKPYTVADFIVHYQSLVWVTLYKVLTKKRQFLCNVTHTCIKFFTKTIQIIKKKPLHTSIIKEYSDKLFQNLTSGFGEENLLRISSCLYSAKSPHSPEPCLWTDQNFANIF